MRRPVRVLTWMLPLVLAAAAVAPPSAAAQPRPPAPSTDVRTEEARSYFRSGERAFNAGEFAAAAASFEKAMAVLDLPAIAFSAAQAHRLAYAKSRDVASLRRAAELYALYLQRVPSGERVADASSNLLDVEGQLRDLGGAGKGAGPAAPRPTQLMVTSAVDGARATVAGKAGPLPFVVEVTPGPHDVVVEADGYQPKTLKAMAIESDLINLEVDLVARPSRLLVKTEGGAQVAVDGRIVADAARAGGAELPVGRHLVTVSRNGRRPFAREVELARGTTVTVDARLVPSGQRRLARWVLIGSGVTAAVTGGFALAAVSANGDAKDLYARSRTDGLTEAEAAAYRDAVAQRDDARNLTYLAGGLTAAAATTGLLLYLFDRPDAPEAPIGGRQGGLAGLRVVPVVAGDGTVAATLSGAF